MRSTGTKNGPTSPEAIGPEIFDFFRSLGINIKQLYGQTEASVFITAQPNGFTSRIGQADTIKAHAVFQGAINQQFTCLV